MPKSPSTNANYLPRITAINCLRQLNSNIFITRHLSLFIIRHVSYFYCSTIDFVDIPVISIINCMKQILHEYKSTLTAVSNLV